MPDGPDDELKTLAIGCAIILGMMCAAVAIVAGLVKLFALIAAP